MESVASMDSADRTIMSEGIGCEPLACKREISHGAIAPGCTGWVGRLTATSYKVPNTRGGPLFRHDWREPRTSQQSLVKAGLRWTLRSRSHDHENLHTFLPHQCKEQHCLVNRQNVLKAADGGIRSGPLRSAPRKSSTGWFRMDTHLSKAAW